MSKSSSLRRKGTSNHLRDFLRFDLDFNLTKDTEIEIGRKIPFWILKKIFKSEKRECVESLRIRNLNSVATSLCF